MGVKCFTGAVDECCVCGGSKKVFFALDLRFHIPTYSTMMPFAVYMCEECWHKTIGAKNKSQINEIIQSMINALTDQKG
jgi:uncharacterized protein YlaI